MSEPLPGRAYVYRFFDSRDRLLYVGVTTDVGARLTSHRRSSEWWSEACRAQVDFHESLAVARHAEALAIIAEQPRCNAMRPHARRVAVLTERAQVARKTDVVRLAAEVERLRKVNDEQYVRIAKLTCEKNELVEHEQWLKQRLNVAVGDLRHADDLLDQVAPLRGKGRTVEPQEGR